MTNDNDTQLIKCADCQFARQFRQVNEATGRYVLKVNCSKGHWRVGRKNGHCPLHRILAKRTRKCQDYVSTSTGEEDRKRYLETLAATLPLEQFVYESDGTYADITEVGPWASER
jgi:hypothetical protein